ncbi:MAG: hypothetical protein JSR93_00350 [Verrucomicrobia bacterium]|nr:hypothetical protein [Verrucomicrobiota bacterium]
MSLKINPDTLNYAGAAHQLNPATRTNGTLGPSCVEVFLDAIRNDHPEISCAKTTYSQSLTSDQDPYEEAVEEFKTDGSKTKLIVPIIIEGFNTSFVRNGGHLNTVSARIDYLVSMIWHFLCGGSVENHIVMLTVSKKDNNSYEVEYYDPKGRGVSSSQIIQYSKDTQNVEGVINTVFNTLSEGNAKRVDLTYHNQGRLYSDQSIFNKVDCGYYVMQRAAEAAGRTDFGFTNIGDIADRAYAVIQQHHSRESVEAI